MKSVRYLFAVAVAALLSLSVASLSMTGAAPEGTPQEKYIARYAAIAVSEMYRTGVPASITLAQGLLESRYGLSSLAADGNNHFGIKCHDWTGKKQYADDDKKGECFRVYDSAEESFVDHSDFLRYRSRYKALFEYPVTDYKSWAYGLKSAGYATDPAYPTKLIKLIEDYNLSQYDRMSVKQAEKTTEKAVSELPKTSTKVEPDKNDKPGRTVAKKGRKTKKNTLTGSDLVDDTQTVIPDSPLSLEEPRKVTAKAAESFKFSLSRQMFSLNGVPFIYASEGETIASIASSNNLFVKELLKFNDMKAGHVVEMGEIIYLQAKKKQTAKGLDKHIADRDGETLWEISQHYGVKLQELCRRNGLSKDYVLREGDSILLR